MLAVTLALAEPIELPTKHEPPPSNEGIATLATAGAIGVLSAAGYIGTYFAAENCSADYGCGLGHWAWFVPSSVILGFAVVPTLAGIGSRQLARARRGEPTPWRQRRWRAMRVAGAALHFVSTSATVVSYLFAYDDRASYSGRYWAMAGTQIGALGQAAGIGMFSYGHNALASVRPSFAVTPTATVLGISGRF